MSIAFLPFKYYSVLPDYSLTTKIREESWDLDQLFPILKRTKEEFRRLMNAAEQLGQARIHIDDSASLTVILSKRFTVFTF